ncbi:MAG: serine/threonine protein kinase [Planctomycetes bacterium]|nr:serine/threonine protein kinase [Planctomycetota bacterium]
MSLANPERSANRWALVRGLFEAVSGLPMPERPGFLDYACPDPGIRQEVESLLAADELADTWSMPADRVAAMPACEPVPSVPGYAIERLIGSGGAGSVYLGRNTLSGRRVAIKVVRSLAVGSQALQRFRQECRALSRLSHPGIVQLVETGSSPGGITYLVMEHVDGVAIDRWRNDRQPSPAMCIDVMRQMLAALAHAHDAGVIHRDIKPANVLVDASTTVKLLDFGVARLHSQEGHRTGFKTETGHLIGTFAYMSPEQADGGGERIGVASDVYQSALLLFELLTGRLPYDTDGRSAAALLRAVLMDRRVALSELRPGLPAALGELLDRALAIDPSQRPPTVRAFDAELAGLLPHLG